MNRQDNNFGDVTTNHIMGDLPDDDERECDQEQMDCSANVNGKCGLDSCEYEYLKGRV